MTAAGKRLLLLPGSGFGSCLEGAAGSWAPGVEDAREWARWWRIEGLPEMRRILWERWDPLGLRGLAPADEYDSYANVLASKLKRGNERSDIVSYLIDKGPSITPKWVVRCDAAADALLDWYAKSNAPR